MANQLELNRKLSKKEIIIVLIITLIIALGIFFYFQGYKKEAGFSPEPAEVFEILGKINSFRPEENFLTIEVYETFRTVALSDGRTAFSSKLVKVKINEQTELTQVRSGGQDMPEASRIAISLKELSVGDIVKVYSKENIKDKNEFAAEKIEKLVQN